MKSFLSLSKASSFGVLFLFLLIALELLLLQLEPVSTQSSSKPSQNRKPARRRKPANRNRKKPNSDVPERINCYTCLADFKKIPMSVFNPSNFIFTNLCYNPSANYTAADAEFLTKCSATTRFCVVDVTRMNDVLLSVDRRCGERNQLCLGKPTCLAHGYGLVEETCTFCCGGRLTEDDPEYDEELHANYTCLTDW